MKITGLNQDNYLINNPIWLEAVELDPLTSYLELVLTDVTDPGTTLTSRPLRIYPFQQKLRYNLQEIVKGNFPAPDHPELPADGDLINTNYRKFRISVMEQRRRTETVRTRSARGRGGLNTNTYTGDVASFEKTFIRGGKKTMQPNQTIARGEILTPEGKIPRWAGYPIATYTLDLSGRIVYNGIVPGGRTEHRKVVGCDPIYVRFLNQKGGYSFWLFETTTEVTDAESGPTTEQNVHAGFHLQRRIEVETRVQQRFIPFLEDLIKSPEIHLFNRFGMEWAKVVLETNRLTTNNYETVYTIPLVFRTLNTETPSITW